MEKWFEAIILVMCRVGLNIVLVTVQQKYLGVLDNDAFNASSKQHAESLSLLQAKPNSDTTRSQNKTLRLLCSDPYNNDH